MSLMLEILQWTHFNNLPNEDKEKLNIENLWTKFLSVLRLNCDNEMLLSKDLYINLKKTTHSILEFYASNFDELHKKLVNESTDVLLLLLNEQINIVSTFLLMYFDVIH